jgi:AraC family transcriptional regulator
MSAAYHPHQGAARDVLPGNHALPGQGNAPDEIARILDRPPVLGKEVLRGDTRLTARWAHGALHDSLPGMRGHVIMTYYGDGHDIVWHTDGQRIASRTTPATITLIPDGHDGRWDIAGPIEVSHVYLTQERLQSCADLLAGGQRIELLGRVGFADPVAARILGLLGSEAAQSDPSSRLFVEQAIDLLCTQLVRGHSSFAALSQLAAPKGLAAWQVKRVTGYMRDHLDEEIGLGALAALVNLSRFHFALPSGRRPAPRLTSGL